MPEERSAKFRGFGGDDARRRRRLWANHRRHAWAQNAGLGVGDGGQVIAQKALMIDRDRGDHMGHRAGQDIGRIQSAAEPGLEDQ